MRLGTRVTLVTALVAGAARTLFADEPVARETVLAARDRILSREEFSYAPLEAESSWLSRAFDVFGRWVAEMHALYPVAFWCTIGGLVLVLVVLVAHIVWTLRAEAPPRRRHALDLEEALRRADPGPYRAEAVACAQRGEHEAAVRALYVALLLRFDRAGHVRFARHKAVLDYRIELAAQPDALALLDRFCTIYHPGSFGRVPPTRAAFDALLAAYDGVRG